MTLSFYLKNTIADSFILKEVGDTAVLETSLTFDGYENINLSIKKLENGLIRVSDKEQAINREIKKSDKSVFASLIDYLKSIAEDLQIKFDEKTCEFYIDVENNNLNGEVLKVISASLIAGTSMFYMSLLNNS